ncbi:Lrp/AsnC family transcriptional regulator [Egicoccus halophilus]|uniref:HTH asnC-type domain-containing protein n=1 Tax=Egicoccus halophilus TaxID=1670830 RepID=A0A8J3AAA2_9ACTN|nr:Lrp/AsnC ligand binding domain-containing protein [Egicoccus halophilus]GGI08548.1 hypothetical protein GCM10011354_29630 [Egicoccus halophilus]
MSIGYAVDVDPTGVSPVAPPVASPDAGRPGAVPDPTDRRILALLCEDGRMSVRAVAAAVGVSRASAYARIERLRACGIITGFSVQLDPARLGLTVTAHVLVTLDQQRCDDALAAFRALPEVTYCAVLAADHDVLLVVRARDIPTLREVVLRRLQDLPHVRRTRTVLVLDERTATPADLLASTRDGRAG